MIRPAKFADTPRIVELMGEMHLASKYVPHDDVDVDYAKKLVAQCIQRHGGQHDGASLVMVSETNGSVEGFFIGMLDRTYMIGRRLCANDIMLYCSSRAPKTDAMRLFDAYLSWAMNNPKVASIKASWTDAMAGGERMGALYERKGFTRAGEIYELFVERIGAADSALVIGSDVA